ncbi:hypothetical protein WKH77_10250 [Acinetobacter baumannii]
MTVAIQQAEVRKTLAMMVRGETVTVEGIIDYKIHFDTAGYFNVNGIRLSKSLKETVWVLWHFNWKYIRRKDSVMRRYWNGRPLDITKYFPQAVHPDVFEKFSEKNKALVYGNAEPIQNYCRICAAVRTDSPRTHHKACPEYLDQDTYPTEQEYINPLGKCPNCASDDGLSIDSSREMALSFIDCGDCGFRYEANCPEDVLEKRFKKLYQKQNCATDENTAAGYTCVFDLSESQCESVNTFVKAPNK